MNLTEFLNNLRYAFRPSKPLLTARLAGAVLRAKVLKRPRLRYVDCAVDFACNMRCEHCFATSLRDDSRKRMETEDYARMARQAMELGAVNFSFQGGEPLLFKKLPEIIEACQPHKNLISVTTNGTLLSPQRVAELKKTGVDILTVSLDSGIAEEHDRFRKLPGSWQKAVDGIHEALRQGLHVTLGCVVTHDNLHSEGIRELSEFAHRNRTLLYFILPVPAGEWARQTGMLLTQGDLGYVYDLTRRSNYLRTDFEANLGPYGCGAAKEILYLTPYGDVFVCPFLHMTYGNVLEEDLKTIRSRALRSPWLDHYHQKCLVSSDQEFIDQHLSRTWNAKQLPIDAPELEEDRRK